MSNVTVHETAAKGFGEGTNELYDRARPSYQSAALAYIKSSVGTAPPYNVVEIGAGTGIFTRALTAHPDWKDNLKNLKAIEPSSGMRDVFSQSVKHDRVTVHEGTFDTTGVEDGWADIIIIAQAFHWCPDYDRASAEFARILKPNGVVAFIWNLEDRDRAGWVAQVRNRIETHEAGTPQFRLGLWRQAWDTASYQANFDPPEEKIWSYTLPATADLVKERACSKSYIAVLKDEERAKVLEDLDKILEEGRDREWIDEEQKIFHYPYQTFLVIARKKL
ncbi:hypothetical protein PQX77_000216 [Marasmius sp. AFHP31]|nr:hypothetical protein PQX77_000216 [Marasmius sp. AFHP31]